MGVVVKHPRYGQGTVDSKEDLNYKMVTVFFDDRKFRQVHRALLKTKKKKFAFYD